MEKTIIILKEAINKSKTQLNQYLNIKKEMDIEKHKNENLILLINNQNDLIAEYEVAIEILSSWKQIKY